MALAAQSIEHLTPLYCFPEMSKYIRAIWDWEINKNHRKVRKNRPFDTLGQRISYLNLKLLATYPNQNEGSINKLLMYQDKQEGFYRVYEQVMYLEAIHEATGIRVCYWIPSVIINFFYKL